MEFLVGILFGIIGYFSFSLLLSVRASSLDDKKIKVIISEAEKIGSIKYRFSLAEEMSKQQMDLMDKIYEPSKGAAHSRWKNEIIQQVDAIEKDKLDIFRTLIKDGVDPYIQFAGPEGQMEKIRMSEAVARAESNQDIPLTKEPINNTDSKSPRKDSSNLIDITSILKEKKNGKSSNPKTT